MYVANNLPHKFTCKHTDLVNSAQLPLSILSLSDEKISAYNGDAKNKEDLRKAMHTMQAQHHSVYELTDKSLAVFGPVKASNTLGFCHVRNEKRTNPGINFISSAPEKIAILVFQRGNKKKRRSICIHLHTLFCSLLLAKGMPAVADPPSTSALATHSCCPPFEDFQSYRICVLRAATMRLYTNKTLPYHFGTDLMSRIKMKNALTFQGSSDGWPLLFAVESKVCKVLLDLPEFILVAEEAVFYTQT